MKFTFEPDEEFKSLTLSVIDDNVLEIEENFALSLFQNTSIPDVNIDPSIAEFTLQDNEGYKYGHIPYYCAKLIVYNKKLIKVL